MFNRALQSFSSFALIFLIGGFAYLLPAAHAATTLTDIYNDVSSLKTSAVANHDIVFTTPTQIDEGETVTIAFPSYTLSSLTEDDVDVLDDGVELTTAATCSGTEEASVAFSGTTMTITICAGDGGAIASASSVTVEIGTNATASGSGTNQATNPSSEGTYYITVAGTFGGSGSVPMPIVSDDDSGVNAIVGTGSSGSSGGGSSSGGGGGGGGGSSDSGSDGDSDGDSGEDGDGTDDGSDGTDDGGDDGADGGEEGTDGTDGSDGTDGTDSGSDGSDGDSDGGDSGDGGSDGSSGGSSGSDGSSGGSSSGSAGGSGSGSEGGSSGSGSGDQEEESDDGGSSTERGVETVIETSDTSFTLSDDADAQVLAGDGVLVRVEVQDESAVTSVEVVIGETSYEFVETQVGEYAGIVSAPADDDAVTVIVTYDDGEVLTKIVQVDVVERAQVYELIDGQQQAVEGAIVTVFSLNGTQTQWDATLYGQQNPIVVGTDGAFGWYVPNGTYLVTAGKSGYEDREVRVLVRNNILARSIELQAIEQELIVDDEEETPVTEEAETNVVETVTQTVEDTLEVINDIRELPEVQTVGQVTAPVAVAAAATSGAVLATSFNLLNYLRYLFSSPILFFARRRREKFGVVYNAMTKLPIDLAIVRLYTKEGRLKRTMVTDKSGRYFFKTEAGEYRLTVTKNGYTFPSQYVRTKVDGSFLDVYTGGAIAVTDKEAVITANIPIDPNQTPEQVTAKKLAGTRLLRAIQNVLALSGVATAVAVLVIQWTLISALLLLLHIGIYTVTKVLARPKKPSGWGIVKAKTDGKPVGNVVVRLFEPTYNKLIESTITDSKGRYAFLAGPNTYYVTYEKGGYEKQEVRPIDYTTNTQPDVISVDVNMKKDHNRPK